MLQIRIVDYSPVTNNDFPRFLGTGMSVILDGADNRSYSKALSSTDEGIKFTIPKSDPNASYFSPYDQSSFVHLWEVWDTDTNKLLNFGPITEISDEGTQYNVTGAARSALLADHFQTLKTFYARIDAVVEETRFENIAAGPSTQAIVSDYNDDNTNEKLVLPYTNDDDRFHNLSKKSKDYVIDDQNVYIPFGKVEPPRDFYTTAEYWTGMGKDDSIMLDFGATYPISRLRYQFPWWGGITTANDRTYDYSVAYTNQGYDVSGVAGYNLAYPTQVFSTTSYFGHPNHVVTKPGYPMDLYIGWAQSGNGVALNTFNIAQDQKGPINAQFLTTRVSDVHAWYGNDFDAAASHDGYRYQCDPSYRPGDDPYFGVRRPSLGVMTYKDKKGHIHERVIPEDAVKPANDCHASIVEIGAYQEIIEKKSIKPLAIQRIDNNNRQISYYHNVQRSEMFRVRLSKGLYIAKYEPGTLFRKFGVAWSGANSRYTQFYSTDCVNCYPDDFHFGVIDDDNTLIYASDSSSNSVNVTGRQYTKHVMLKGASNFGMDGYLTWVDTWLGKSDPMSWGGSYSYSETVNDYFVCHFRGESFKWYATVPAGKTGATVKIEIRHKSNVNKAGIGGVGMNIWSGGWVTIDPAFKIPDGGYSSQVIYEIPYKNNLLLSPETVYEIRVTNLDGGYCSVDCIEGYWSASFTEYNEDSTRIIPSQSSAFKQIYDKRFTGGSMYKWNAPGAGVSFKFEGDRIIVQSAMGRYHGHLTLLLLQAKEGVDEFDTGTEQHVFIPGGDPNTGALTVNLDTGRRGQEIPNYIIFDSNDYFTIDGLPWGKYTLLIISSPYAKYWAAKNETGSDSFVYRCKDCRPKNYKQQYIYQYVYLDAIGAHERVGLSVNFDQKSNLDILKSVADAIQVEWSADPDGLVLDPRIGTDTDVYLREGENTLVRYQIVNDISKVATRLLSYGTSIDGIDQFTITEDKKSRDLFGRTITRQNDFRDIASYSQLIGLSRTELKKRNKPEKRITVSHTAKTLGLNVGDSFVLWTKQAGKIRMRINRMEIAESTSTGRVYNLECVEWPQIT